MGRWRVGPAVLGLAPSIWERLTCILIPSRGILSHEGGSPQLPKSIMSKELPQTFRKLIGKKITKNFREAVVIEDVPLQKPSADELLIKNRYVGINASDVNKTGGIYDPTMKPPYLLGFEAVGQVVSAGTNCTSFLNKPVAYMYTGAYSEFILINSKLCFPIPEPDSKYLPLLVSGLTASLSLDMCGRIKPSDVVLVTAAAGGTGQFAVQYAKSIGCHVIGTCSSKEKADFLKSIGCDRPVVYTSEDLNDVLQSEYPKGVDVVYETVGGKMFEMAVTNIALHGRVIVVGFIEAYLSDRKPNEDNLAFFPRVPIMLLSKSASVNGFLLFHFTKHYAEYLNKLFGLYSKGALKVEVDFGKNSEKGPFVGLESIADAVDYLYTKKSIGKIVVELNKDC